MPDPLIPFLQDLLQLPGVSGFEAPVRHRIRTEWQPLVDEISVSRLGSLQAVKRGGGLEPRSSVVLAAHMDAVGLMVTHIIDGFLRVTSIGSLDARVLPGQLVTVHGRRDLPGLVALPPDTAPAQEGTDGATPIQHLWIDTGLPAADVGRWVRPGDPISFAQPPMLLGEDLIAGHSLDNRASIAAVTVCLQELRSRSHSWDVIAVGTVREEESFAGAATTVFALRPTVAVAVDVTYASGLGQPEYLTFALRGGPTNIWSPDVHPAVHQAIEAAARRCGIPITRELAPVDSLTDAGAMQLVGEGIPTGAISIPLRYMHTPVEVVAISEIRRAGLLLAEFVSALDDGFGAALAYD
jgi:endoglucanase